MGKKILFLIVLVSIAGLAMANWNILNYKKKTKSEDNNLKNYCESWRINVEVNNIREFIVVPEECTGYIGKYMTSYQYNSDCQRTVEECQLYISNYCCIESKDAWIFDVDDTLLSTVPYFKQHNYGGQMLNLTSLEEWMRESDAPALEHTRTLYQQIKRKGFKIFLISTRRECVRDATIDNLINVGYHGWSGLVLRGIDDEYKPVKRYKAEARKKLVDAGYHLLGAIGDQWSSFEGCPSAKRTFKLPNSMYYIS